MPHDEISDEEKRARVKALRQAETAAARARRKHLRECEGKQALDWQKDNGALIEVAPSEKAGEQVAWVMNQTPLDRLHLKGTITDRQYSAGHEFRIKCGRFMGGSKGVGSYGERMARGEGDDHGAVKEMDARHAVQDACRTVGERSAAYLFDVCYFECAPSAVGKTLGYHHSTAIDHFQAALNGLADFWRI